MNDEASATHADPARAFDGQYQLGAEIGAGALGVVYRGVDERLDKPVAIKVWHSRLDDSGPLREQYDAEARALTALEHPNVVAITDYGIAGEAPYLIMELLEGQTLEARMRAGALPAALTQTFMQSVLRGLGYMHMRGVMHRNLKPDNVFLHKLDADSEQLKLLDVGLESLPANTNAGAAQSPRTAYVPPEHDAGTEPDGRSDVYAAGVMMLHMLSGREPTRELVRAAAESADLLGKLLPSATPEVRAFIARAVATERGSRFGNADQMLRALLELASPWADDPPGAVAMPVRAVVASIAPQSVAAPAEHEPAALGETEALATPPDDELIGAPAEADHHDQEVVLGPIGLMAKLRAHKKLLLIGGGVIGLAAVGGMAALVLSSRVAPEHVAELAAAEHEPAESKAKGKGKSKGAKKAKAAPVVEEEEEEEEEEEAQPIIKREEPGSEHAPAEPPKYAARLGEHGEHGEHAEPGDTPAEAKPNEAQAKPTEGVPAAAKSGAEHETAQAKPSQEAAASPVAESPPPAAAEGAAQGKPAELAAAEHAAVVPAAAAASGKTVAPAVSGKGEAAADAKPAAAVSGEVAATAEPPKGPTPEQIGAERHIEPDKDEIRQMLALAIAPQPRVAAKNPWEIDVPSPLQALRDAIAKGEHGTPGNLKALRRYNSANPQDVYGHLLLGGFYANRGFSLDALDQYDMAFRIDSSSRGAPEMLRHAITMVEQGIADVDAARFLARVYGREASGPIALRAARTTNPAAARRLKDAQARVNAAKRR